MRDQGNSTEEVACCRQYPTLLSQLFIYRGSNFRGSHKQCGLQSTLLKDVNQDQASFWSSRLDQPSQSSWQAYAPNPGHCCSCCFSLLPSHGVGKALPFPPSCLAAAWAKPVLLQPSMNSSCSAGTASSQLCRLDSVDVGAICC